MKLKKDAAAEQREELRLKGLHEQMMRAVRAAVHLGGDAAMVKIEGQAATCWDGEFGSLQSLQMEQEAGQAHYKILRQKLDKAHQRDEDIPPFIEGKAADDLGESVKGFSQFLPIDRMKAGIFGTLTVAAMILSLVNAQVALMSSYIPALMDAPFKAWLIAGIAPAISVSIKLLPNIFTRPKHSDLAKKGIYLLTALAGLLWVALFAQQFDGFSSGDDWSSDTGNLFGLSFTYVQLMTEILCGSAMFTAFQAVLDRYQQYPPIPNVAKGLSSEYARQLQLACDKALKDFEASDNAFTQHSAKRQGFIQAQSAAFDIALARHNDLHGTTFDTRASGE